MQAGRYRFYGSVSDDGRSGSVRVERPGGAKTLHTHVHLPRQLFADQRVAQVEPARAQTDPSAAGTLLARVRRGENGALVAEDGGGNELRIALIEGGGFEIHHPGTSDQRRASLQGSIRRRTVWRRRSGTR